jgi:hypothetical protein
MFNFYDKEKKCYYIFEFQEHGVPWSTSFGVPWTMDHPTPSNKKKAIF